MDIKKYNDKYQKLLKRQLIYINKNIEKINTNLNKLLELNLKNKNHYLLKNCCDFEKLEEELIEYKN